MAATKSSYDSSCTDDDNSLVGVNVSIRSFSLPLPTLGLLSVFFFDIGNLLAISASLLLRTRFLRRSYPLRSPSSCRMPTLMPESIASPPSSSYGSDANMSPTNSSAVLLPIEASEVSVLARRLSYDFISSTFCSSPWPFLFSSGRSKLLDKSSRVCIYVTARTLTSKNLII